jgi:choline kinase
MRSLTLLRQASLTNITIVTGHLAEAVEAAVQGSDLRSSVRFVENTAYRHTGTARSLCCAADCVETHQFLLLEADLLFSSKYLAQAKQLAATPTIFTADVSGSGDEVFVLTDPAGNLLEVGKRISAEGRRYLEAGMAKLRGEMAGISVLPKGFIDYLEAAGEVQRDFHGRDYESFLVEYASVTSIRACWLKGVPWTEIDNAADLRRAREQVWPRLVQEGDVMANREEAALS